MAIDLSQNAWQTMLDVNLTGVWATCRATAPHLIDRGAGSIILTSSIAGLRGLVGVAHYTAAKHGVVGLMRSLAKELAPHNIRVNTVHPTNVDTPMIQNDDVRGAFRPDLKDVACLSLWRIGWWCSAVACGFVGRLVRICALGAGP